MNAVWLRAGAIAATTCLWMYGCGGESKPAVPMGSVTGTVTYKTALPEGQIIFQHASGASAAAKFGADGKYLVEVPQGKNQVAVRSIESSLPKEPGEGAAPGPRVMETYTSRIPERYANFATSALEVEVKEGTTTYDVKLEDK